MKSSSGPKKEFFLYIENLGYFGFSQTGGSVWPWGFGLTLGWFLGPAVVTMMMMMMMLKNGSASFFDTIGRPLRNFRYICLNFLHLK